MITVQVVQAGTGCTQALAETWLAPIQSACTRFGINNPFRAASYLAQIGVESAGLSALVENLNYSAARLSVVWPYRFAIDPSATVKQPNALALSVAGNPELIANQVYANRMGNGSPASGDGWKYRGRGPLGLTGKDNYRICGIGLGLDLIGNPDQLMTPGPGSLSAAWFLWSQPKFFVAADAGNIDAITQMVNGAPASEVNHGPLRASRYKAALNLILS
jgi:putative chitinase